MTYLTEDILNNQPIIDSDSKDKNSVLEERSTEYKNLVFITYV